MVAVQSGSGHPAGTFRANRIGRRAVREKWDAPLSAIEESATRIERRHGESSEIPLAARCAGGKASEDVIELQPHLKSLLAEANVEPHEDIISNVETHAEAYIALQIVEVDQASARSYLARIREDCHIESAEDLVSIFDIQQKQIVVVKAVRTVSTQGLRTSKNGLHVKRHRLSSSSVGHRSLRP